ncbi:sensor histidine kinase [Paenibacillus oryzisoli]|uniref:sensor histidine kinase n=1 Tax=Paenibacillus oryzisoli TaxID=1850517 RepID=UPI003D2D0A4C
MTFLRYLSYERPLISVYVVSFLMAAAIFVADRHDASAWGTFVYAFVLISLVWLGFLVYRYRQHVRIIRQMQAGQAYDSLSLEGEFAQNFLEELTKQHIRQMNQIQEKQKEHYDYIVSWFHEIKTPIAVLRLLQQTELNADSLREEIAKIEHYVDQALYYAKLDSFNHDYDIQKCDVIGITKALVKAHATTFISKRIGIRFEAETLAVQSDPKWLQFIVNQLVTNSLKYTGQGGKITISASQTPQDQQLRIRDNGIGISPSDLPRIFQRGFTGETGRTHAKSTGMGLYLAQQLANKLGHTITCTSEAGAYTEFVVHFPKDDDPYVHVRQKPQ